MITRHSAGERETEGLAEELARQLQPGTVFALEGDLGAGKTAFVRGLARGLGYTGEVTSPTFALVHEYRGGRCPLYHFDMYRVEGLDSLESTGFFDYLGGGGILAIEWSENIREFLPDGAIRIHLAVTGEETRTITWEGECP